MEVLVASLIGAMSAAGVYLILRRRTFAVVLGTIMLSYAINLFLVTSGRLAVNMPPLLGGQVPGQDGFTDPLPQALVLTAIVIGFGMSAVTLMIALGAFIEGGDDRVDMPAADRLGVRPDAYEDFDADPALLPAEGDRADKRQRLHMTDDGQRREDDDAAKEGPGRTPQPTGPGGTSA